MASGVPVAAYPVLGPKDVIGGHPVGVLDEDLGAACLKALTISRQDCRAFAVDRAWDKSARQFLSNCRPLLPDSSPARGAAFSPGASGEVAAIRALGPGSPGR